jgi:hypothetical protein
MAGALDAGQGSINAGLLQQLERYNKEVDVLNGKLDQALQAWSASGDALHKQVYEALNERMIRLDQLRQDLQSQLAGVLGAVNNEAEMHD